MSKQNEEPKIVVDDDWKSQVEQEKQQLREQMDASAKGKGGEPEMPPASMPILITTLATQALASLGQIPDPMENKPVVRKQVARHFIDTLAMLEEKTVGNLDEDEAALLSETVHQLRMIFVQTPDSAADKTRPVSSTLELPG
jgi:hypothetical protein